MESEAPLRRCFNSWYSYKRDDIVIPADQMEEQIIKNDLRASFVTRDHANLWITKSTICPPWRGIKKELSIRSASSSSDKKINRSSCLWMLGSLGPDEQHCYWYTLWGPSTCSKKEVIYKLKECLTSVRVLSVKFSGVNVRPRNPKHASDKKMLRGRYSYKSNFSSLYFSSSIVSQLNLKLHFQQRISTPVPKGRPTN